MSYTIKVRVIGYEDRLSDARAHAHEVAGDFDTIPQFYAVRNSDTRKWMLTYRVGNDTPTTRRVLEISPDDAEHISLRDQGRTGLRVRLD